MTQETIIPETIAEKIVKGFKRESRSRKLFIAVGLLTLCIIAGFAVGYNDGYHQALIDFGHITGQVIRL
jgi:hypothetical protein